MPEAQVGVGVHRAWDDGVLGEVPGFSGRVVSFQIRDRPDGFDTAFTYENGSVVDNGAGYRHQE